MREDCIRKTVANCRFPADMADIEAERASFSWERIGDELGSDGIERCLASGSDAPRTRFATGRFALDLLAQDVFWCAADAG